jgi:hypothetical protein
MPEIKLTRGFFAIVDEGDLQWLSRFKWFPQHSESSRLAIFRECLMVY